MTFTLEPIGIIHSCYPEKFGIPRQPGLVPSATARLELFEKFSRPEMVKGLDGFSHIWVQFIFHNVVGEGWKPTIRPPFLGGKKRVGVFASRSPHRPNHLGMSVVRLSGIESSSKKMTLNLSGVDLLDKTPVVDIKPYISYSDCVENSRTGFATPPADSRTVTFSLQAEDFCVEYEKERESPLRQLIVETLALDPRPASQRRGKQHFGMLLWDVNVRFDVTQEGFMVEEIEQVEEVFEPFD